MPYYIESDNPECENWATVKEDGEIMGCHLTKQDAIDQMVALSIGEDIDPGGERDSRQVDLSPPDYIRAAAARGLELVADGFGGDGLTDGTKREARRMADGDISADKVVRANAWAARHAPDLDAASNSNTDDDGWPGNGAVAHYLWGINPLNPEPARKWFANKAEQVKEERSETMNATMEKRDTDNLVRHLRFDVSPNEDGLTLDGYGAVFNEFTEIEDAVGLYREQIAPGAFKRTLGMRTPILQFDHGSHPLIGSIPLGRILSLVEDEHGLRVKARLSDNWLVQPVRDAIRDGGVSGMSFRFRIVDEDWVRAADGMEERTIREVELYEVGPVVFPAYEQTSVGVRSRDVLDALEDATVRGEVAHILARGGDLSALPEQDDPDSLH